jgi:hypothetical protein
MPYKPTIGDRLVTWPALITAMFLRPHVTRLGWDWFVVPVFGLPRLTWYSAFGLLLVVAVMNPSPTVDVPETQEKYLVQNYLPLSIVLLCWGFLWLLWRLG